jgi:hypothetical protein
MMKGIYDIPMYTELEYKRGYLITDIPEIFDVSAIDGWETANINGYTLRHDPEVSVTTTRHGTDSIAIVGPVINPFDEIVDSKEIASNLIEKYTQSDLEFFDHLDLLSGRFVIFVTSEDNSFVVQDAAGTRSTFYDQNSPTISSHPKLIADIREYDTDDKAIDHLEHDPSAFPGLATPYREIKRLTPNTLLRVPEITIERFFPREKLDPKPLTSKAIENISSIFETQARLFNDCLDLSLSLSAGLDSRVSLAATCEVSDDIKYITWVVKENDPELDTVSQLADTIGINIDVIELSDEPPEEFAEVFQRNTAYMSQSERMKNAYNFYQHQSPDQVEIRSNVAEIATRFYPDRYAMLPKYPDVDTLAKLYAFGSTSDFVQQSVTNYVELTDYHKDAIYNYDPYDLYYWEYKMGSWLSHWFLELEIVGEKAILYNNRELLKHLLSLPATQRENSRVFRNIIAELWPECLDVPVNPHKDPSIKYSDEVKRFVGGTIIRQPTPIYETLIITKRKLL